MKDRPKKYEPKLALKNGVKFDDLIKLSLKSSEKEPQKKKSKK